MAELEAEKERNIDDIEDHDLTFHDWAEDVAVSHISRSDQIPDVGMTLADKDQSNTDNSWVSKANVPHRAQDTQDSDGSSHSHKSDETIILSDSIFNTTIESTFGRRPQDDDNNLDDSEVVKKYQAFAAKILGKHDPPPREEGMTPLPQVTPGRPYYSDPSKIQPFPTIAPTDEESFSFVTWFFTNLAWVGATYLLYLLQKEELRREEKEKSKKDKLPMKSEKS